MIMDLSAETQEAVGTLREQRAQLQGWLARLEDLSADVSARVAERVRSDYTERLRGVMEALAGHRDAIGRELDTVRAELAAAEARFAAAMDELDETRLRHQIGELDTGAWDTRRPQLENAVKDADRATDQSRLAAERLRDLLAEIEGVRDTGARRDVAPESGPAPVADEPRQESVAAPARPIAAERDDTEESDDFAFLQELDRAIAGSPSGRGTAAAPEAGAVAVLACKECGSSNDPQSWYCEVCGVEL